MDTLNQDKQSISYEDINPNVHVTDYQAPDPSETTVLSTTPQTPEQEDKKSDKKWWIPVALLCVAAITGVFLFLLSGEIFKSTAPVATEKRVIKIGFLGPLTGSNSRTVTGSKQSITLALKEFNQEGVSVELVFADSKCEATDAVTAVNELIAKKVVAIIGDYCSGATLAAAPIANREHITMISPASTSPKITESGEYIFRTVPSDALQGKFIADLIASKGLKTLAILYGNEPYGIGLSNSIKGNFETLGGTVQTETFENGEIKFDAQLAHIKAINPEALILIGNETTSSVAALLAIQAAGIKAAIYGSEAFKSQTIVSDAAAAAEGLTVSSINQGSSEFQDKFRANYQAEPDDYSAQSYDAAKLLTSAFSKKAYSGEALRKAISTLDMQGASGHIVFDASGDIHGNYDVYKVTNSKFVKISQ